MQSEKQHETLYAAAENTSLLDQAVANTKLLQFIPPKKAGGWVPPEKKIGRMTELISKEELHAMVYGKKKPCGCGE